MALRLRVRRFRTAAVAIGFVAMGCSSFGDGTTTDAGVGQVDGGPGFTADGSVTVDEGGGPDGGAGGATLLDEGFEADTPSCAVQWQAGGGAGPLTIAGADAGHDSTRSCRLCQSMTGTGEVSLTTPSVRARAGKRYVLEAFALREHASNPQVGTAFLEQPPGAGPGAGSTTYDMAKTWKVIKLTREATDAGSIRAVFTWTLPSTTCVLIDDVVIQEVD